MLREQQFISPAGQTAWNYYKEWMQQKHKSVVSSSTTFKKSKFFTAFYNFTKFVKKTAMPDTDAFIHLMVRKGIDPKFWTTNDAYRKYLEYVTRQMPTMDFVKITIKTIIDISEAGDCEISEVFDILTANEIIQLVEQRRLSPWVLLHSKEFARFFINKTSSEERIAMETIINPDYWKERFKKHPQDVNNVKKYIQEMGL